MTSRFFRGPIPWPEFAGRAGVVPPPGIEPPEPRWNIPPMSWVPVIRPRPHRQPGTELVPMLWSLVPGWWRQPLTEKKWTSFAARVEGIGDSPTFRGAFRHRHCLVPASGFVVWSGAAERRIPYAIGLRETPWFCFAGIWETWGFDGGEIDTFAILTCAANDLLAAHGDRMPVILRPEEYDAWLSATEGSDAPALAPFAPEEMEEWPADPAIGNVRNQGPQLIGR